MKFIQVGFPLILVMQNDQKLADWAPFDHLPLVIILDPLNDLHYSASLYAFNQFVIHHEMKFENLQKFC